MTKKISLNALTGIDFQAHEQLHALESFISRNNTVAFNSVQTALQSTFELLGTRTHLVPIIMPVTAPPDTVCAALRAGGHPLLLDIDEHTLQMQPQQLKEALQAVEAPIVVLTRPGGGSVSEPLLEFVQDHPTVCDTRLLVSPRVGIEDLCATFNVFDLSNVVGTGSVILHKFVKQVEQLRLIRSGIMGHSGALGELQASKYLDFIKIEDIGTYDSNLEYKTTTEMALTVNVYLENKAKYIQHFKNTDVIVYESSATLPTPLYIRVPNARQVVSYLHSYDIEAALGVYPLYNIDEIKRRYKENPEYPIAEKLSNEVVALPTHIQARDSATTIVKRILEVI